MPGIVDCRGIEPEAQRQRIRAACAELELGGRLVLRTDQSPARLLEGLSQSYPGAFEWRPLEASPGSWCGVLTRRARGVEFDGVLDCMTHDHLRIHRQLSDMVTAARDGDWGGLVLLCSELLADLRRHFHLEESVIFPALARRVGERVEMFDRFRREHEESYRGLEDIASLAAAAARSPGAGSRIARAVIKLQAALGAHAELEDRFLYMAADLALSADDRAEVLRALQRL